MTKIAPRSATTFHSDDVVIPERPTTKITIGGTTYTARAPKYQVWWDVARMLEDNSLAGEAARRLEADADSLTPAEARELVEQLDALGAFGSLHLAVIYGVEDGTGRVKGGFLRRCLRPEDWAAIAAQIDDDDADLDLPDLYQAAMTLQAAFDPWFQSRSETMGLPQPKPQPKLVRATSKSPRRG